MLLDKVLRKATQIYTVSVELWFVWFTNLGILCPLEMKPECVKQTQNSKSDPIVDTQSELRNVGLVLGRETEGFRRCALNKVISSSRLRANRVSSNSTGYTVIRTTLGFGVKGTASSSYSSATGSRLHKFLQRKLIYSVPCSLFQQINSLFCTMVSKQF
jgi:hypothetical protein